MSMCNIYPLLSAAAEVSCKELGQLFKFAVSMYQSHETKFSVFQITID